MSSVLSALLSVLSLLWALIAINPQTYRPLMLLIGAWAIIRSTPTKGKFGQAIDAVWVTAALFSLGWPLAQGEAFFHRAANPLPADLVAGAAAIVVVLEAARRAAGWIPPIVTAAFLTYAMFGRGHSLPRLIGDSFMSLKGLYGAPLGVASSYVVLAAIALTFLTVQGDWLVPKRFLEALVSGGRRALPLIALAAVVGVILATLGGAGL